MGKDNSGHLLFELLHPEETEVNVFWRCVGRLGHKTMPNH